MLHAIEQKNLITFLEHIYLDMNGDSGDAHGLFNSDFGVTSFETKIHEKNSLWTA